MNSKKIVKIATILMIIATILACVSMVFAAVEIPESNGGAVSTISGPVQKIMGIAEYICYAAAVILLIILGVKFMVASPEAKAEIKKSAIIYVVGAVLVFAAAAVLRIIRNTANNVTQ